MDAARQEQRDVPSAAPSAAPPSKPGPGLDVRHAASRYAVIGVWAVMILVYALAEPGVFMTRSNFISIFTGQYALVFMTMALLCTIIVGEFVDLSVPSVFGIAATILPVLVTNHHWGVWPAAIVAIIHALAECLPRRGTRRTRRPVLRSPPQRLSSSVAAPRCTMR